MNNEILAHEKRYWDGMAAHNYEVVKSLTRFPCIVAGKDGVRTVEEPEFKKMFDMGANVQWTQHDISKEQVQIFNDVAIIAYHIQIATPSINGGVPMTCACTSTWIKENEQWVCAMHTECEAVAK